MICRSIKTCWENTSKIEKTILEKTSVKSNKCLDVSLEYLDNHEIGIGLSY